MLIVISILSAEILKLEEDDVEIITSIDFFFTLPCDENCSILPVMIISAPSGFNIRVSFNEFIFNGYDSYLEIGDGVDFGREKRLAYFHGTDIPGDVTSIAKEAWVKMTSHCAHSIPELKIAVRAVTPKGNRIQIYKAIYMS